MRSARATHANPLQPQVIAPRQRVPFLPHVLESVFCLPPLQIHMINAPTQQATLALLTEMAAQWLSPP
jgi:hypothetical protein